MPAVAAGLKETGLACAATHISFDDCKKDLAAVVEKHRAWGCEYVGVGSMPEEIPRGRGRVCALCPRFWRAASSMRLIS